MRIDFADELDAWIRNNGWDSAADFETETGMLVTHLLHRWFYLVYIETGKYATGTCTDTAPTCEGSEIGMGVPVMLVVVLLVRGPRKLETKMPTP
jgi:hypothetical protein